MTDTMTDPAQFYMHVRPNLDMSILVSPEVRQRLQARWARKLPAPQITPEQRAEIDRVFPAEGDQ